MSLFRDAMLIAKKDLRVEARSGEITLTTSFFAVLVAILTSLSFYTDDQTARLVAPGILWTSLAFAGILAMGRSWARERENDVIRALLLSPVSRGAIFFGKAIGAFLFLSVVEVILLPVVALLFHIDLTPILGSIAALLVLGTVGFVAAGTLFSAMSVRTRARELVLSIVLFPLVMPTLLAGVVATREVFGGASLHEVSNWLRIMAAFDIVFVSAGFALFETLIAD